MKLFSLTFFVVSATCSAFPLLAQEGEGPPHPRPRADQVERGPGERGPRGGNWQNRQGGELDPKLLAKLREVMKTANQAPQVLAARKEAKAAATKLGQMIHDRGAEKSPELAKRLDELGFEWMPPRRRSKPGPQDGPKGPEASPERKRVIDQLNADERRQLRELIRDLMGDPEVRRQRRVADQKWESFKKVLRAEVAKLDPETVKELEKQRPKRERRGRPQGPRPKR